MRVIVGIGASVTLACLLSVGPARAEQESSPEERVGEYGGVEPGRAEQGGESDKARRCRGTRRFGRIGWVGFQPRGEGSSRLFIQLCGEVEYEQELAGSKLRVTLFDSRFVERNARRRLDTRFFDTALAQVNSRYARRRGPSQRKRRAVEFLVTFKSEADAQRASASMRTEQDGYTYLYLDFAPPAAQ